MNNKKDWQVKDMLEYAKKKYLLLEGCTECFNSMRAKYEKQIRRTMYELNMTKKNGNNRCIYVLPERKAKYLIDVVLKSYFEKNSDQMLIEKKYSEEDKILNIKAQKALEEFDPLEHYEGDYDGSNDFLYNAEIEKSIDRQMLHAIFNLFYEFDENSYREDYIKRKNLTSDDIKEPYNKGYSLVNHKLQNFVNSYCKRKIVK